MALPKDPEKLKVIQEMFPVGTRVRYVSERGDTNINEIGTVCSYERALFLDPNIILWNSEDFIWVEFDNNLEVRVIGTVWNETVTRRLEKPLLFVLDNENLNVFDTCPICGSSGSIMAIHFYCNNRDCSNYKS